MTSTNMNWRSWVTIALCSFLVMWSGQLFAKESNGTAPEISNIGFIKHPSAALRERFPMCDAFLKVEWLQIARRIGYAEYETTVNGEENHDTSKRFLVSALVTLGDIQNMSYDISFYRKQGRLEEILNRVRQGNVEGVLPMVISYEGQITHVHPGILLPNDELVQPLLSDYRKTVCVAYPNGERVWIAEGKAVRRECEEKTCEKIYDRVLGETGSAVNSSDFAKFWILDVNRDGKADYLSTASLFYSAGDKYFFARFRGRVRGVGDDEIFFPSTGKTCIENNSARSITTDGKSYYLGVCDLTAQALDIVKE